MLDQCVEGFYEARFEPGLEPELEAVADNEAKPSSSSSPPLGQHAVKTGT